MNRARQTQKRYEPKVREEKSRYHYIKHNPIITSAATLYRYLEEYRYKDKEHFLAITLDGASRVINTHIISIGTLNQSIVHPREVFYPAIKDRAASIIIAHNHPSGELHPSVADKKVTARLKKVGELVGIDVADHIILSHKGYYSFLDENEI